MTWITANLPTGRLSVREEPGSSLNLDLLCEFGARRNPRRGFLFVSTVLGKHIPSRPAAMRYMHAHLSRRLGFPPGHGPVVFVTMAETAVGLGYGVFESWLNQATEPSNALFLHTTRYPVAGHPLITFEEGHSHAPNQFLHMPAGEAEAALFQHARTLVLIDDEASTGQTFLNLWQAIRPHMPNVDQMAVVTLTDFMGRDRREAFDRAAGVPVQHISAARAEWRFEPAEAMEQTPVAEPSQTSQGGSVPPVSGVWGRTGRTTPLVPQAELIDKVLRHAEGARRVRIIGTGEFMHAPYVLGTHLECMGKEVHVQSSSRSPILEYGPIRSARRLPDVYGRGDAYFIYNAEPLPGEATVLLHEVDRNEAIDAMARDLNALPLQWT